MKINSYLNENTNLGKLLWYLPGRKDSSNPGIYYLVSCCSWQALDKLATSNYSPGHTTSPLDVPFSQHKFMLDNKNTSFVHRHTSYYVIFCKF